MKTELTNKNLSNPFNEARKVRVKFNFPLASPTYDPSIALKKAKEEKSFLPFEAQSQVDINTTSNFYEAGKIYEVDEDFYKKFAEKKVETFNGVFGKYSHKELKFTKRPVVPYMIKVDSDGDYIDRDDKDLDLYPS